ncbi:MAG: hypothetical protein GTN36_03520 [Candidatus Aenigmarchaeota archaeon]|nr:hypothetical protein [Candidatus Aenigmarchaeota archaeon]
MEEKIELNVFLNKLVSSLAKKYEKIEKDIKELKSDIEKFKKTNDENSFKEIENKLRKLEISVNSIKNKSQIDKSILKLIETEEQERKSEEYGRRF